MSLGRSFIDQATLAVDGGALPTGTMSLSDEGGTVTWIGPTRSADELRQVYVFTFDYFSPAEVSVTADKATMVADGVEQLTLSVICEDTTETTVRLAIFQDGSEIGTIDVTMTAGIGAHVMTIAQPGAYVFKANEGVLDATWGRSKFLSVEQASMEAT